MKNMRCRTAAPAVNTHAGFGGAIHCHDRNRLLSHLSVLAHEFADAVRVFSENVTDHHLHLSAAFLHKEVDRVLQAVRVAFPSSVPKARTAWAPGSSLPSSVDILPVRLSPLW